MHTHTASTMLSWHFMGGSLDISVLSHTGFLWLAASRLFEQFIGKDFGEGDFHLKISSKTALI